MLRPAPLALVSLLALSAAVGCDDSPAGDPGSYGGSGQNLSGAAGVAGAAGSPVAGSAGSAGVDPCAPWPGPEGGEYNDRLPEVAVSDPSDAALASLGGLRAGCERPGLLVVRVEPAWCEPCGQAAAGLEAMIAQLPADTVSVVTVLSAGVDNAPATDADVLHWRVAHPQLPGRIVRPLDGAASALLPAGHLVPLVFLADRRTLRVVSSLDAPADSVLSMQLRDGLDEVGAPAPTTPDPPLPDLVDDRFEPSEWALVSALVAPLVPPPSPSNAHADDPDAAALGALLFTDTSLAGSGVACATCHRADKGLADGLAVPQGVSVGTIHTPSIATAAWSRWQFWDGRADSLWSQALGPLENPVEMNGTRLGVAHRVADQYATAYEGVFGALPPLADGARFPAAGKPGDVAYDTMSEADRAAVDRVFVNVGKALEAHERTLRPSPLTRLTAYVNGQPEALTPLERDGLAIFLHAGCINCHSGPTLSDGAFHNILMPSHAVDGPGDPERRDGITRLLASPFRADGVFSDDPASGAHLASLVSSERLLGQQKTPSLRDVARTGPWGHGGTFATLGDVVAHYGQGKASELMGPRAPGTEDVTVGTFVQGHNAPLVAFLEALGD